MEADHGVFKSLSISIQSKNEEKSHSKSPHCVEEANQHAIGPLTDRDIGETEAKKERMLIELEIECLEVYRRKLDEAANTKARLHQSVAAKETEFAALIASLSDLTIQSPVLAFNAGRKHKVRVNIISAGKPRCQGNWIHRYNDRLLFCKCPSTKRTKCRLTIEAIGALEPRKSAQGYGY